MLDYGWGHPSSIMLSAEEETGHDTDPNRPVFDPYNTHHNFSQTLFADNPGHLPFLHPQSNPNPNPSTHFPPLYDSRASSYPHPQPAASMLTLDPGAGGYIMVPKSEPMLEFNSRIGLNLGGRTYFASSEDDFVNRLYRRSRLLDPGSVNSPMCQAEGCNADLTHAKHYHRRHKVCEFHSKTATVIAAGLTQRFCQQCSRFHLLSEFDNGKRSCRKRLADHNRRRRKSQHANTQETSTSNGPTSSSQNLTNSGPHSSWVTVAISPPRISLDCFGHGSYCEPTTSSTASTNSLFYSNG